LKIKGNTKYLYALMDDETGFWIAQQVAETKNTADITPLFSKGKKVGEEPDLTLWLAMVLPISTRRLTENYIQTNGLEPDISTTFDCKTTITITRWSEWMAR
jgi:hypothetical protein